MRRSFLALQGAASPFFRRLLEGLAERGHATHRINFCGGDLVYAGTKAPFSNYADKIEALPGRYLEVLASGNFTDILLFGDCRKIHEAVYPIAQQNDIRVNVFEEGYVRPNWLTLETHGVNGRSRLPRDPACYREQRSVTPPCPPSQPTGYNLYERAFHDIRYRAANALYAGRFPHYQSHRPHNGYREYAGLARRLLLQRQQRIEADRLTERLLARKLPYYLFPLQLNSDSQIQVHSPFEGIRQAIDHDLHHHAGIGHQLQHPGRRLFHERGDARQRHRDIALDAAAGAGLRVGDLFADAPEGLCVRQAGGHRGVQHQPLAEAGLEDFHQRGVEAFGIAAGGQFDQHHPVVPVLQRRGDVAEVFQHQVQRRAG
ncbi:MAG: hypothetical protein HOQ37_02290, partial [Cupriavidus sp.]|nr:hypothetical protein [Cupriavidus sp.]